MNEHEEIIDRDIIDQLKAFDHRQQDRTSSNSVKLAAQIGRIRNQRRQKKKIVVCSVAMLLGITITTSILISNRFDRSTNPLSNETTSKDDKPPEHSQTLAQINAEQAAWESKQPYFEKRIELLEHQHKQLERLAAAQNKINYSRLREQASETIEINSLELKY